MKKSVKMIILTLSAVIVLNFGVKNINIASKNNQHECQLTNIYITSSIDPIDK